MKNFLKLFFVLLAFHASAQELAEDFIASLPEALIGDMELSEDDPRNIQNPDTKLLSLEASLRQAEETLNRIRYELDTSQPSPDLKRIGESFFNSFQSTYLPIIEPAGNTEYLVDSGDLLTVHFVGQFSDIVDTRVERDGSIGLPKIGNLQVAGLSLGEVKDLIIKTVDQTLIGVNSFVTLTEVRDMNLLIVGNVNRPGMYTLHGGSTPLSLIYAAGGINSKGSYRSISHKRNGELIQNIDLYDILIKGDLTFDKPMRSGDVVLVNAMNSEIRIDGDVANPGIYEFIDGEKLSDFSNYIGLRSNYNERIIKSSLENETLVKDSFKFDQYDAINLKSGDTLEVLGRAPIFKASAKVSILGEVNVPGDYFVSDQSSLLDLLNLAGGYTKNAFPMGGMLLRKKNKTISQEFNNKLKENMIDFLASSLTKGRFSTLSDTTMDFILKERFSNLPQGRVITEFDIDQLSLDSSKDILMQDGDMIIIPKFENVVYVVGQVTNPVSISLESDRDIRDYVKLAGAQGRYTQDFVYLFNPDGTVRSINLNESFLKSIASRENYDIYPGSVIYVPSKLESLNNIEFAATISPILSSLALSLASLSSINNN